MHWRLFQVAPVADSKVFVTVRANLSAIEFEGLSFTVLDREMELLYLVMHGGHHAWFRLKWLEDVHRFISQDLVDKGKFTELVGTFRAERMVSLCNALLQRFFPCDPVLPCTSQPSEFAVRYAMDRIAAERERSYHTFPGLIRYFFYIFTSYRGLAYKMKVVRYAVHSVFDKENSRKPFSSRIKDVLLPGRFLKQRYKI